MDGTLVNDPEYTRWIFRITGYRDNQQWYEQILPHHVCTDDDYAEFYPITSGEEQLLSEIRSEPNRGLLCLDWDEAEPFFIYGDESSSDR